MKRVALLFATCACNRIFGVEGQLAMPDIDARQFDARPPMCPDPLIPPSFEMTYHQLAIFHCISYTPTEAGFATALCSDENVTNRASAIDDTGVQPLVLNPRPYFVISLRPDPEGDLMLALVQDSFGAPTTLEAFAPASPTDHLTWNQIATIPIPQTNNFITASTPSRGPDHHVIISKQNDISPFDYELVEIAGSGASWTVLYTAPASDASVYRVSTDPSLTPDGLRMVFYAESPSAPGGSVHYSGRAHLEDRFAPATPILDPIGHDVLDAFLTEDCARIYFGALTTTIYLEQPPPQ